MSKYSLEVGEQATSPAANDDGEISSVPGVGQRLETQGSRVLSVAFLQPAGRDAANLRRDLARSASAKLTAIGSPPRERAREPPFDNRGSQRACRRLVLITGEPTPELACRERSARS